MLKNEKDVYGMIRRKLQDISEKPRCRMTGCVCFRVTVNAEAALGGHLSRAGQSVLKGEGRCEWGRGQEGRRPFALTFVPFEFYTMYRK